MYGKPGYKGNPSDQQGLTLLELLLVVTILSAMAYTTLAVVDNDSNQVRFEDTRNRLEMIRAAVLGSRHPTAWHDGYQGGYVTDNGILPINIAALVDSPANYDLFGVVSPQFDPIPDAGGVNNGPAAGIGQEITLNDPLQTLLKGHRGFYVAGSRNNRYRDGWGTDRTVGGAAAIDCPTDPGAAGGNEGTDVDAVNHGWCVTHSADGLYVDSYGLDAQAGALTGDVYEQDMAMAEPVLANDWLITVLAGSTVSVVNQSGSDIDLGPLLPNGIGPTLRVSLLTYFNDADQINEYNWRRVTSSPVLDRCLDGDGDGLCNGAAAPQTTTVFFTANFNVPQGEHLLVLVSDPDGVVNTVDDTTVLPAGVGNLGLGANRIKLFSRGGTPDMEIRIL